MSTAIDFGYLGEAAFYSGAVDRAAPAFGQVSRIGKVSLRSAAPHVVRRGRKEMGKEFFGAKGLRQATPAARTFGRTAPGTPSSSARVRAGTRSGKVQALASVRLGPKIGIREHQQLKRIGISGVVGTLLSRTGHSPLVNWAGSSPAHSGLNPPIESLVSLASGGGEPVISSIAASAGQQMGHLRQPRRISIAPRRMSMVLSSEPSPTDAAALSESAKRTQGQEIAAKDWSRKTPARQTRSAEQVGGSDPERLVDFLSERAARPPRGVTGVDPRLGPIYPGGFGRQW